MCIKLSILLLMVWWIYEYYNMNQYIYVFKNSQYFFNNLLNNPLNKYHPILFFTSYIFIFSLVSYTHSLTNYRTLYQLKFFLKTSDNIFFLKNNFYWILMSISLYLGSWWALQEGSWGGWWNWDASEVFGLLILTLLLLIFHLRRNYTTQLIKISSISILILVIIFFYCILQLSYTLVSHNFGLSLVGYGYVRSNFIIYIGLVSIMIVFFLKNTFKFLVKMPLVYKLFYSYHYINKLYNSVNYTKLVLLTFFVLLLYEYLLSFNPIINNIFWKSFNIEIFNKWFSWLNVKLLIITLLLLFLCRFNLIIWVIYLVYNLHLTLNLVLIPILKVNKVLYEKLLHIIILLLLSLPLCLSYAYYSEWGLNYNSTISPIYGYLRGIFRNNILTENLYIHNTLINLSHLKITNTTSFFFLHSSIDPQFFSLNLTDNLLTQVIHNHTYLYTFKVFIYDTSSLVTDNFFTLLIIITLLILLTKLKIIF